MRVDELKAMLLWCTIINYVILFVWFFVFIGAHDWLHRMHSQWFALSRREFDAIHYGGIAFYKLGILLLNLVPLIALHVIT